MSADLHERIVIASSKLKLGLMLLGAFLFVAGGLWLYAIADTQGRYPPIYVKAVSVAAIGFFGLCGIFVLFKLFDGSPGLILDREGIIDNSSGVAAGRVAWRDIRDIQVVSVSGQCFLAFVVGEPEKYLGKGNFVKRWFVKMNYRMYGTPVFISANSLKVKLDDLEQQIRDFYGRHRTC
jgi:hypothetical protein